MIHHLLHVLGVDGPSYWNYFWSGFGSGPLAWCVLPLTYYIHHMCHEKWCYRMGHPVDGVVKCRKHVTEGTVSE